ncbi:MAG: hypothetical protein ACK4I8_07005 [Armatimonadota bacterium]
MNRLVALLNRLRYEMRWDWLTPSQLAASEQLMDFFRINDVANLFGAHGVGKTFLAWVWHKEWKRLGFGRIAYFPFASPITPNENCRFAIIDNLLSRREVIRDAIRQCRLCGYERVLLITVHAAADQLPKVRLDLTEADKEQVVERLRRLGYPPFTEQPRNLWECVVPSL